MVKGTTKFGRRMLPLTVGVALLAVAARVLDGQQERSGPPDHASHGGSDAHLLHLELTPVWRATAADSARAAKVAAEARRAVAKYRDPRAAEADGYEMFAPHVKTQRVYHYTNWNHAVREAFRFDPAKPTSLLYEPQRDGSVKLVGVMYGAPKRMSLERLNERVPLGLARWHRHVNLCVPAKEDRVRWLERRDGKPLFGPESSIATRKECAAVGGEFHESIFGWMVHANVFADDPKAVWADEHGRDANGMVGGGGHKH